jgi:uncharacterized peroxidase-related enzyme
MNRLKPIDPQTAQGNTKTLFDDVQKKLGVVPNMMRLMANSPAVLEGYLALSGALGSSTLDAKTRERIALATAELNACGYCLSAHTFIGGKLGISPAEVEGARRGTSDDPRTKAILDLARSILVERGRVRDADLLVARKAGVSDAQIAEIVATVALNVFTNWFNHVADPVIDFPEVRPGEPANTASAAR